MPKDEKSANADQTNGAEDDISGITTESAAEAYFGKAFATASLEEVDPIELRARCLKIWEAAVAKSPKIKGLFGTRIRNARIKALVEGLAKAKVAKAKAAKAAGQKADSDDLADRTVVDAFDHLVTARIFLETKCPQHPDGHTLIWWQGVFYRWTGPRWEELRPDNIEHRIDLWLADECCFEQEQEFEDPVTGEIKTRTVRVKVNPGTAHVNEVVAALATETDRQVRTGIDTAFGWLGHTPEGQWLSVENGILNMDDRTLIPHTPRFFTLVSFRAEWNPEAAPVRRTAFGHYLDDLLIRGGHAAVEAANAIAKDHGGKWPAPFERIHL